MDSGGFFFLMRHTPNEVISGEKALITFLSNLYGPLSVHCLDYISHVPDIIDLNLNVTLIYIYIYVRVLPPKKAIC